MDEFVLQARIHHSRGAGKRGQTPGGVVYGDGKMLPPFSETIPRTESRFEGLGAASVGEWESGGQPVLGVHWSATLTEAKATYRVLEAGIQNNKSCPHRSLGTDTE
jgi:hypothetical protein